MNIKDKLSTRATQFDICFAELSPEAQNDLQGKIDYIASVFPKNGGGVMSAKELIIQVAKFVEQKEATNDYSQLHTATTSAQLPSLHTINGDEDL